ncbi:MAG: tyrosine decarboxylase MfnA [Candidatus Thermoplasmatota archaeon]|nr:tyrosine decarboxylase MfnA [Euryarchaeota archaeon]MBU4031820.1 tyrosine decarboxylase MfnA [Candidatus Thermoplasmatota archaeon]MBU4072066.1 tyrosine decarboxylase MfnA [Candidatus Thermoplasmatota archaeon]MBU4144585.1 tyrosine decarboxylase MfnA [Candidatus Thermoplasmatota archaeon]MBU4592134.1 tyrosine decarboxylase MfnA [Candidatus Thermoplasmatota archaeon]
MWAKGENRDTVMLELEAALDRDHHFSDGHVISSMCTKPLDIAAEAHGMFLESNLGNAGLYPGTLDLEKQVIDAISQLLNGPADTAGGVVSGGTEANITALWIARNITGKKKVIFPRSAHFSFHKACDILAMESVMVSLTDDFTMDLDEVARHLDGDVAAVVGIAGTTELGAVDDIRGISEMLPENVFLHVDAAFGGFVLPFLRELGHDVPDFDLSIFGVSSIAADPHKMGMSTVPSGALLVRNREWIRTIHKDAPYLDMIGQLSALSGTRCSAAVAASYAAMRSLGRDGYTRIVEDCMKVTRHALASAERLGLEPVIEPIMNILCLRVPDPKKVQKMLDQRGWKVSVAQNPSSLRLVMMPHVTMGSIDDLFAELEIVLGEL